MKINRKGYFSIILLLCISTLPMACSEDDDLDMPLSNTLGPIDSTNPERIAAKELYFSAYESSKSVASDISWTGNSNNCDPGNTPQETKNKIIERIHYFRTAVGLENTIVEDTQKSGMAQQGALMMAANNNLSHSPPDNWKCFTEDGKMAAANSLLTTAHNAEAVDAYIQDIGANNGPAGHRRWLLFPRLHEIGIGNTNKSNAIWVLGNHGTLPNNNPDFIAWPPKGFVPSNLVYNRWTFSVADADFSEATVSIKNAKDQALVVTIEPQAFGFGDPTIVFSPEALNTAVEGDIHYTVEINGVLLNEISKNFSYEVILFNVNK